jgi:enterochelin esterase family protein
MLRGTLERIRFSSAALQNNALSDPAERELLVYLPPSYARSEQRERRYPVLVVLTGFASTHQSLLNFKAWEPNFLERFERVLAQGCPEAILVMPDCFTRWGGSQFIDSRATGAYQTYIADDVLALVDRSFRTRLGREARGIVGKSSGGFGALRMGMDRPDRFSVIGSHAGDCAFELSIRPRFVEVAPIYERHGGVDGFVTHFMAQGAPRSQAEFHAIEIVALAAAYAPLDSGAWPRGELPFDPYNAMINDEKWARWLAHDPLIRAENARNGLADARLVFLDAGKSDEYGLQFGARMLAQRLKISGAMVDHEEFDGGHMGTAHRYEVSLPRLLSAIEEGSQASSHAGLR